MIRKYFYLYGFCLLFSLTFSCSDSESFVSPEPELISPVVLDLENVPYSNLSEYNFFEDDMAELSPVYGVLPYKLVSGLFIDYAKAKTFVWMPENSSAQYVNDYSIMNFPEGAVLITTHYFENVLPDLNSKMIETRLLIKKEGEWILVNYVWNEEQTEAEFTTDGSIVGINWIENNEPRTVNYRIPAYAECVTCHSKNDDVIPIGLKPQNLNHNYFFTDGENNQLNKWVEFGYLNDNYPSDIVSAINWEDASQPLELRVRSYFDINCSHCHSEDGYCGYRSMRFSFKDTGDLTNTGVCVEPDSNIGDELIYIVAPSRALKSVVHFRMSSVLEQYRMPLLGRTLKHDEGVELIESWINSLDVICN